MCNPWPLYIWYVNWPTGSHGGYTKTATEAIHSVEEYARLDMTYAAIQLQGDCWQEKPLFKYTGRNEICPECGHSFEAHQGHIWNGELVAPYSCPCLECGCIILVNSKGWRG